MVHVSCVPRALPLALKEELACPHFSAGTPDRQRGEGTSSEVGLMETILLELGPLGKPLPGG